MGTPEEFANVTVFLCSLAAAYVNGVMLQVDGGIYQGTHLRLMKLYFLRNVKN